MKCKAKKSYWQQGIPKKARGQALLQGIFLLLFTSYIFYDTFLASLFLSPYLFWYMKSWETQYIKQEQRIFLIQFKDGIQAFSNALHVGYSPENALKEAMKDLGEIYHRSSRMIVELEQMNRQVRMNLTLEAAMEKFALRVRQEDVQTFVTAFNMAKRSGGDTMEMIRKVVKQMAEKVDVEREIQTILAAKKTEFRIMTAIPYGMICYVKFSFPEITDLLYGTLSGNLIMTGCLLLYVAAYEYGKRIIAIEV